MSKEIFYTPVKHIPAFAIVHPDYGEPRVEFLNPRTGKTDDIPLSEFIEYLQKYAA